jgi:hypothetical protein
LEEEHRRIAAMRISLEHGGEVLVYPNAFELRNAV